MSAVKLNDAEVWDAYWTSVGWPDYPKAALAWWKNPGPIPANASFKVFRAFAPVAVQRLTRDCGLPQAWLDAPAFQEGRS